MDSSEGIQELIAALGIICTTGDFSSTVSPSNKVVGYQFNSKRFVGWHPTNIWYMDPIGIPTTFPLREAETCKLYPGTNISLVGYDWYADARNNECLCWKIYLKGSATLTDLAAYLTKYVVLENYLCRTNSYPTPLLALRQYAQGGRIRFCRIHYLYVMAPTCSKLQYRNVGKGPEGDDPCLNIVVFQFHRFYLKDGSSKLIFAFLLKDTRHGIRCLSLNYPRFRFRWF
jgi:hypothetical protein